MGKLLNLQCELREYDKGIRDNVIRQRNIGVNSSQNKVTRRSKETTKRRLKGYRENGMEVLIEIRKYDFYPGEPKKEGFS